MSKRYRSYFPKRVYSGDYVSAFKRNDGKWQVNYVHREADGRTDHKHPIADEVYKDEYVAKAAADKITYALYDLQDEQEAKEQQRKEKSGEAAKERKQQRKAEGIDKRTNTYWLRAQNRSGTQVFERMGIVGRKGVNHEKKVVHKQQPHKWVKFHLINRTKDKTVRA